MTNTEPRPRCLVVDDQEAARDEIAECADVLGHEFEVASSVEDARDALFRFQPDYVVLDLQLPRRQGGVDKVEYGMAFLDEIARDHPLVGVVVVTANAISYAYSEDVHKKAKIVTYVPKPFIDDAEHPKLTKQMSYVFKKCMEARGETDPGGSSAEQAPSKPHPVATIDIRIFENIKNKSFQCSIEGNAIPIPKGQHPILEAFAKAQAASPDDADRHMIAVGVDDFGLDLTDERAHYAPISRLKSRLMEYAPHGYPKARVLGCAGYQKYSLGLYCIDSGKRNPV